MHGAHEFLRSLTIVLSVAAVTTVVFQWARQPVVLGYLVAGLIIGPHVPVPLIADQTTVQGLSELGVILLMFSLGLEFSFAKLGRVGPSAGVTAVIQSGFVAWLGFLSGRAFGWTVLESVFLGAAIAISSTTIIAKVFDEQKIGAAQRDLVVGILLIEDLIAIVFMAALTAVATGAGLSAAALAKTVGTLAVFLAALVGVGLLVVPRLVRMVVRLERAETTLVASVGLCFLTAYVAQAAGYSVALGAFLAGSLIAESGHAEEIEHLVRPVRDVFAAVFFVSVGMLIDPRLVVAAWAPVVVVTAVVIVGKIIGVAAGAFVTGAGTRTAIQAGLSLAQIGEFAFIIAGLGLALGATREFLYPVAVAVAAITTLTTPWMLGVAPAVADVVDRALPHRLQTFTTLYGAWLERLREAERPTGPRRRRYLRLLALDVAGLCTVVIVAAVWFAAARDALVGGLGLEPRPAGLVVAAAALLLTLPFLIGVGRLAHRVGSVLAEAALPRDGTTLDLGAAPRRALVVTLQLGVVLAAALVVVAVTQPFLPSYPGPALLVALVAAFGFSLWRSAADLEGHVRAGSQAIAEALTSHARRDDRRLAELAHVMPVQGLLTGLGEPVAVQLDRASPGIGRTLAELNVRGRTGASVLVIIRDGRPLAALATAPLAADDVLAVAGTRDAIAAAIALLRG